MGEACLLRKATPDDAELICHQRRAMFVDMGEPDGPVMDGMIERFRPWVRTRLASGEYLGWIVEASGEPVAGAGLWRKVRPPSLRGDQEEVAYVLNVYTSPAHRGQGLARRLMVAILEHARELQVDVVELHASDQGRPLYESLGFVQTNEMRMQLT